MERLSRLPIWFVSLLYMACYVPYIAITRSLATTPAPELQRPLTGLEILPASLILSAVWTYVFVWRAGWWRAAHLTHVGSWQLPRPTRWTALSGLGTALILFTVPLSFTFEGVSIPFMQLLMRGDLLLIAPLVDLLAGRKVRWYSWLALVLVAVAMLVTVGERRGFQLPPLAWLTLVLYTLGYFVRLWVMTRIAKTGSSESIQMYFVEEKLVGIPLAVLFLALLSGLGQGKAGAQLEFGFVQVWTSPHILAIAALSVLLFVVSIFSVVILLDKRENSFCVPMERSASILAGVLASLGLAAFFGHKTPTSTELIGALLLVAAIVVLSLGPRFGSKRAVTATPTS
jgi:drug/metabolite transporter (DMT)-like permease